MCFPGATAISVLAHEGQAGLHMDAPGDEGYDKVELLSDVLLRPVRVWHGRCAHPTGHRPLQGIQTDGHFATARANIEQ